ncbi:hypothetical protein C8J56DRAFT_1165077, partial [Mycena floridula]
MPSFSLVRRFSRWKTTKDSQGSSALAGQDVGHLMLESSLPSSQWISHYLKIRRQHESAHKMLRQHGPDFIPVSMKRHAAYLNPRIWTAFETNTFIKEDLLHYYDFLYQMLSFDMLNFIIPSLPDQAAAFRLPHAQIDLPVYSLPGWPDKLIFAVNGMDTITDVDTGIELTLIPSTTIRCSIPTGTLHIPNFRIQEVMQLSQHSLIASLSRVDIGFTTWACEAKHPICDLPINIVHLQTEPCSPWTQFNCDAESP